MERSDARDAPRGGGERTTRGVDGRVGREHRCRREGMALGGDYGPRTIIDAVASAATAARSAVFGDGGESAAAESTAENTALQLASSRVRLADVSTRCGGGRCRRGDALAGGGGAIRAPSRRVRGSNPRQNRPPRRLSAAARETGDRAEMGHADVGRADVANAVTVGFSADATDRSVAAEIRRRRRRRRRNDTWRRWCYSGRAARALLAETEETDSAGEAVMHVGDAVEWLHAGRSRVGFGAEAHAGGKVGGGVWSSAAREAGRRAMRRELRECRAAAERARQRKAEQSSNTIARMITPKCWVLLARVSWRAAGLRPMSRRSVGGVRARAAPRRARRKVIRPLGDEVFEVLVVVHHGDDQRARRTVAYLLPARSSSGVIWKRSPQGHCGR